MNRLIKITFTTLLAITVNSVNAANWTLDKEASDLHFLSVKKNTVPEINTFDHIDASIKGNKAKLAINTESINTNNNTRDFQIQTYALKTGLLPNILLTMELTTELINKFQVGDVRTKRLPATLQLGGAKQNVIADVHIAQTKQNRIVVSSLKPVIIDINDFNLLEGFDVMRDMVGLNVITHRVPVYFNLVFDQTNDGSVDRGILAIGNIPTPPSQTSATLSGSTINVSWADSSDNESHTIVSVKRPGHSWDVVDKIESGKNNFLYETQGDGTYLIRVQRVARGRISDYSQELKATVNTTGSSEKPTELNGGQLYSQQCSSCHGANGNGPTPISGALQRPDLQSYIKKFMPYGQKNKCGSQCAAKIVTWMKDTWETPSGGGVPEKPAVEKPVVEKPVVEKPVVEKPVVEKPVTEKPAVEKPAPVEEVDEDIIAAGKSIYDAQCLSCHGSDGKGNTPLTSSLLRADLVEFITHTMPYGVPGSCDETCATYVSYYMIQAWGGSEEQPATELPIINISDSIAALDSSKAYELLNKISLNLVARKPTDSEKQRLIDQGSVALESIVDEQLESDAFINRIKNTFNDLLLTEGKMKDAYHSVLRNYSWKSFDNASAEWVKDYSPQSGSNLTAKQYIRLRQYTSRGHVNAPLELIGHVIKRNLPFSEILTANYAMLNWYSAKSYGLESVKKFRDLKPEDVYVPGFNKDPEHYLPVNLPNVPSAGVLTTGVYMHRYPTTTSNVNRHRAYTLFKQFLDTDILAISGERPGDGDSSHEVPTLTDPSCTSCHQLMDPVASSFKNWISFAGEARPYYTDKPKWDESTILPVGFNGQTAPKGVDALPWVASKVVQDKRFSRAMVKAVYKQITGTALVPNTTDGVNFQSEAYLNQQAYISVVADKFKTENYDFKAMAKRLVLGKYSTGQHDSTMENLLITPSQLNKKIKATLGEGWDNWLGTWGILYGGINSNSVTIRNQSISGAAATIQLRMAEDMSCHVTAKNFAKKPKDRTILAGIEPNITPSSNTNIEKIKQAIVDLYHNVLGIKLTINSEAVSIAYDVYLDALDIGQAGIADGSISTRIANNCKVKKNSATVNKDYVDYDHNYYTRAWQAVVQFVLMNPRYFYM